MSLQHFATDLECSLHEPDYYYPLHHLKLLSPRANSKVLWGCQCIKSYVLGYTINSQKCWDEFNRIRQEESEK